MPLTDDMHLISVDDHLIEPPTVWTDRLPRGLVERGPHIRDVMSTLRGGRRDDRPAHVWFYNGREYPSIGLNAVAGKPRTEWGVDPVRYDDMLPGCYDPKARVADMDLDGVQAALCFPSFPRFAGGVFVDGVTKEGDDPALAEACVRAWNDFHLDEWCATAPDRFIPLVLLPLWDVDASIAELRRTAAKGARAIAFPEFPEGFGLPSFHTDHWDRLLDVVEEVEMPLCMHFGSGGVAPQPSSDAPMAVMIALFGCNSMWATADMIFSPMFHRHPKLKVALSEGGIGWVPYIVERMDYTWDRHRWYQNINRDMPPSELFAKHIYGCFIEDREGVERRHVIGIDNITWECDYPHSDSHWPESRVLAKEVFADVPDEDVRKIVETNARGLYRFPRAS